MTYPAISSSLLWSASLTGVWRLILKPKCYKFRTKELDSRVF